MNRKGIKKIMLFLLAFMLVFPVYSFGKAEAVQAAALKAPKLSKVVRVNKSVKITWKKSKGASGYYVMRKTENSSWKKIKTVKGGSKTSYTDKKVKSGTTYYCTATSAVSFGIQYDKHARAPYTGKAWFMIENVAHNGAGGQNYIWVQKAARDKTYHVMLTVKKDGTCNCYINGKLVKTVKNSSLANTTVYLRVEGSARLNGDSVNATFSNIELKADGKYYADKIWGTHDFTTNKGIKADASGYAASKRVTIKGKVKGLASGQDWDSAYEQVSGIIQFVN